MVSADAINATIAIPTMAPLRKRLSPDFGRKYSLAEQEEFFRLGVKLHTFAAPCARHILPCQFCAYKDRQEATAYAGGRVPIENREGEIRQLGFKHLCLLVI